MNEIPYLVADDDEYEDDEDEQWEDIDEEVCLELNHGRDETNLDESSESLDQFIINNTLTLDPSESVRFPHMSSIIMLNNT